MHRIKPAPNKRVLHPDTGKPLPAEGIVVGVVSPYWRRRLDEKPPAIIVTREPDPSVSADVVQPVVETGDAPIVPLKEG